MNEIAQQFQFELRVVEVLIGLVLVVNTILVPILRDFGKKLGNVSERTARIEGKLASGLCRAPSMDEE